MSNSSSLRRRLSHIRHLVAFMSLYYADASPEYRRLLTLLRRVSRMRSRMRMRSLAASTKVFLFASARCSAVHHVALWRVE
ncbi:hypothetical protein LOC68_21340 [Blastopirellula sp. JC732]|uniref:Uncharacterized protein n=1 Tax=Blastopirellula sediminis TaxID=2894196 RepID=A0A9X1SHY2_9BACT|nr:hypothetical protein [Blastopirellula sediminis]MCC9605757.1 hypothetical protein [Blastopirellula sediminis]MCC9630943.1 hypothetical protein [Blastopirellula sediminis]